MCKEKSAIKAQKTKLLKKTKEELVDLLLEEKRLNKKKSNALSVSQDEITELIKQINIEVRKKKEYIILSTVSVVINIIASITLILSW